MKLREAISEYSHWQWAVAAALFQRKIDYPEAVCKSLELRAAMREWLGEELLNYVI
jgi:hypothetical protein